MINRTDGRAAHALRDLSLSVDVNKYAEGSAMIAMGDTRVHCTVSLEASVPKWLQGGGKGWLSAEYGMLPRSTHTRISREKAANSGRTQEISRLIGRALRASLDLGALGERHLQVDCDVLQADGGTRTASVNGGFVALCLASDKLKTCGLIANPIVKRQVAAVSVGISSAGGLLVDLNYEEDSRIDADINFVMSSEGDLIEIQGAAEGKPFSRALLEQATSAAQSACNEIFDRQRQILKAAGVQI